MGSASTGGRLGNLSQRIHPVPAHGPRFRLLRRGCLGIVLEATLIGRAGLRRCAVVALGKL